MKEIKALWIIEYSDLYGDWHWPWAVEGYAFPKRVSALSAAEQLRSTAPLARYGNHQPRYRVRKFVAAK